ncbi:hypothetical protein Q1M63_13845 (plasmid) [Sinorhizobium meliloti]|nr:hypothetical protein Q1M63_13845 [Sinorhizobium meliloti]
MNSNTAVELDSPCATTEVTMSRSVTIPRIVPTPGVSTGTAPTPCLSHQPSDGLRRIGGRNGENLPRHYIPNTDHLVLIAGHR